MSRRGRRRIGMLTVAVLAGAGCGDGDDSAAGFCELVKEFEVQGVALDSLLVAGEPADAAVVRSAVTDAVATRDSVVAAAPPAIAADVGVIGQAYGPYFAAFESAGFDVSALRSDDALLQEAVGGLATDEVRQATANVSGYTAEECGITLGD